MAKSFKIIKNTEEKLPSILENDIMYIIEPSEANTYGRIIIDGKEWVSKDYIDKLVGDIERLLNEL